MRDELIVPAEKLRRICDPETFTFLDTAQVSPARDFIGQDMAVQALRQGLETDDPEYNVFIIGDTGISRKSMLLKHLNEFTREKAAADGVALRDFCYVYNFEKPDEPKLLTFEKAQGKPFKEELDTILAELQKEISMVFRSDEYIKSRDLLQGELMKAVQSNSRKLDEVLSANGFTLQSDENGYHVAAFSRESGDINQLMTEEEYKALSKEKRSELEADRLKFRKEVEKISRVNYDSQKKTEQRIEELQERLVKSVSEPVFKGVRSKYCNYDDAINYFQGLENFALNNISFFRKEAVEQNSGDLFLPFRVNLVVDNSRSEKMPVIFESNPTFGNLFGKIDKKSAQGGYITDHTYLKAGSIALADGGCLVLNALDILRNPGVWEKLEKTIRYGWLKIEEPVSYFGLVPFNSLNPEPIPVKLKVILVGDRMLYQLLARHDSEFLAIFKIKAEFDDEMPASPDNEAAYAAFIALCCKEENSRRKKDGLLPFDRSAVAKVIEHGFRLADKQAKLSTEFNKIKDLIIEADYWAGKDGSDKVSSGHVKKAIEAQRLRANLLELKIRESIINEMLMIDTEGKEVGQANGLSVYDTGDYSFGVPSRITAVTFLGKKGVLSIDKDVKMSGPIHDKGVHIFSGYFGAKYGKDQLVSFSASICFEQLYGGVEGDSASAAELFCLISSLSELPIDQSFAITGSVNQKGEIQPIGGVNQKIEGFFDVCKKRGSKGNKVIIPHQNIKNLMLREDVVEACREGKFHIYAIKTVDDGLELLLGEPVEMIDQKVSEQLAEMTKKLKKETSEDS